MKKVVIIAPEFPPANSAAVHRSRIFASHLSEFGWAPTVITVNEPLIEGPADKRLLALLPETVRIIRTGALPVRPMKLVGDMGLRCLRSHTKALEALQRKEKIDVIFIPGPPWFTFLLGPAFKKRYGIPFVMDYIDPWVSDWTAEARFPSKRWMYHKLAVHYEKKVVREASFITAVSQGINEDLMKRYPDFPKDRYTAMPYGSDPDDFSALEKLGVSPPDFKPNDGLFHICFTGALQPRGFEILRMLFRTVKGFSTAQPALFEKIRLRFYGTSNQTAGFGQYRVLPVAQEFGLEKQVTEIPERIPYLESLAVQKSASINVVTGSTDRYYHASKLYPCLLAGKPILAICHEEASIAEVMRRLNVDTCVTFKDAEHVDDSAKKLEEQILRIARGEGKLPKFSEDQLGAYSARGVSRVLASVLDRVTS